MSNYGWERITITLPAAEVAPIKKMLRETTTKFHEDVRAEAIRIHKEVLKTRSAKIYNKRLDEYSQQYWAKLREAEQAAAKARANNWRWGSFDYNIDRTLARQAAAERQRLMINKALEVLRDIAFAATPRKNWRGEDIEVTAIHQPTVADVEKVAPRATSKTALFANIGGNGAIQLDGRILIFDVSENNHAVESAHGGMLAKQLFDYLDKVKWTRGTGGYGVGNDEYNRDNYDDEGAGGNYVTSTWGPLGEAKKKADQEFLLMRMGFNPRTGKPL